MRAIAICKPCVGNLPTKKQAMYLRIVSLVGSRRHLSGCLLDALHCVRQDRDVKVVRRLSSDLVIKCFSANVFCWARSCQTTLASHEFLETQVKEMSHFKPCSEGLFAC